MKVVLNTNEEKYSLIEGEEVNVFVNGPDDKPVVGKVIEYEQSDNTVVVDLYDSDMNPAGNTPFKNVIFHHDNDVDPSLLYPIVSYSVYFSGSRYLHRVHPDVALREYNLDVAFTDASPELGLWRFLLKTKDNLFPDELPPRFQRDGFGYVDNNGKIRIAEIGSVKL